MTLSPWIIYFWGIADKVSASLGICAGLGAAAFVILALVSFFAKTEKEDELANICVAWMKKLGAMAAACLICGMLFPSSKTIAIMVVAPAILNSEPIQKDLPEIYQMAKDALKQTLTAKKE